MIETVIDDSNPQVLAYVSELLLRAGRVGCLSRCRADEEGTHRRADDGALPAGSGRGARRSDLPRDDHDRLALEA